MTQNKVMLPPLPNVLAVVPVYNHAKTLRSVVRGILAFHPHVLVLDDGSTDMPVFAGPGHPLRGLPVLFLRHERNRGKGAAILSAANEARRLGMTHIVTIDADGQHNPAEIEGFLRAAGRDPLAVYVGQRNFIGQDVPFASRFGRAFSNFWFQMHTGEKTGDVQSGYRLYPLAVFEAVRCRETRYSFEVEILVRASWAGFAVKNIPVAVFYPPKEERVSHFQPWADNFRISLLNTRLTIRSIIPLPHARVVRRADGRVSLLRPVQSLRILLCDNATPQNLALAVAIGMTLGTLPLIGLHSLLILFVTGLLRVNKIAGLAISQFCMPPFVPAFCIEIGHYMRHGHFLTEVSLRTLGHEALDRVWEWLLGSLLLAPLLALVFAGIVFCLAKTTQKSLRRHSGDPSGGVSGNVRLSGEHP